VFRFDLISNQLGLPLDIVDRLDAKTKRQYVKALLIDRPVEQYKGLVKKVAQTRTDALDLYSEEVIQNLHCWFSLKQGDGLVKSNGSNQDAAIVYIEEGIRAWAHDQKARGNHASDKFGEFSSEYLELDLNVG
jgi:hypothetical protein